jgi:uncharacterized protein YjbI with pentapeptide repeats
MREPKDIIIKGKTLQERLELHKKWLNDENDGVKLDLSCADLRDANLIGANLSYADLRGADLSYADLREAYLRRADLSRADLRRADLSRADLSRADLREAYLRRADLRRADLSRADLSRADLRGVNLDFSQLNLSCKGLNFKIDEQLAKQLMYHVINLMQYSDLDTSKIVKKRMYKWLEDSHVVTKHGLPILKEEE